MKRALLILLALLALPLRVHATNDACTVAFTVTTTSTQIVPTDPFLGQRGRYRWLIQNTGATDVYCAIGTNNHAISGSGVLLVASGGNWSETAQLQNGIVIWLPVGDISCITASGSTKVVACTY